MTRLRFVIDPDLGVLCAVYDDVGNLVQTASDFGDGKHRNHPCIATPTFDA